MMISGAIAGLVGLPILFGDAYTYGSTFQSGLGFAGIAIALLGRNNPIGIALGALLFAYLDEQSNPLQILVGVSPDIVAITPPGQFPDAVWDELVRQGKLKHAGHGTYEMVEE